MKKRVALLLVMALLVTTFLPGCGAKDEPVTKSDTSTASGTTTANTLPEVKLVMYLVGDAQPDAGLVYDEVNKKLQKDINTTVQPKYLAWADWQKKYALIFASGEEFDCIYTADWALYADQSTKNAFMELNQDMVKKNMPEYYAQVPETWWNQLKIQNKIFMIPYLNPQVVGHEMVFIRGDIREKYNLPEVKTVDDFDNYLLTIAKNEKLMKGYEGQPGTLTRLVNKIYYKQPKNLYFFYVNPGVFTAKLDDPEGKVMYALDDPDYLAALKRTKKLADAGVWSKNILSTKTLERENIKAGKSAFEVNQSDAAIYFVNDMNTLHPEWKPEVVDLSPDKIHESSAPTRSGLAINAKSKNADRVMMMMNLFGTNREYYDLTTYGISGKHFEPIGDRKIKVLEEGVKKFSPKTNCPWGWERTEFMRFPDNVPDSIVNNDANWIKNGVASTTPLVSFSFVDTNVKNEVAACDNLFSMRGMALITGQLKDTEGELAKLKADLKKAGVEKIQAELQKQVTEYMNTFK